MVGVSLDWVALIIVAIGSLMTSGVAFAAIPEVTTRFDFNWIAPTIVAVGSFLASVVAAVVAMRASKLASEAKTETTETHKLVNSRMDEMLKLAKDEAAATATNVAMAAERTRTATQTALEAERMRIASLAEAQSNLDAVRKDLTAQLEQAKALIPQPRRPRRKTPSKQE